MCINILLARNRVHCTCKEHAHKNLTSGIKIDRHFKSRSVRSYIKSYYITESKTNIKISMVAWCPSLYESIFRLSKNPICQRRFLDIRILQEIPDVQGNTIRCIVGVTINFEGKSNSKSSASFPSTITHLENNSWCFGEVRKSRDILGERFDDTNGGLCLKTLHPHAPYKICR